MELRVDNIEVTKEGDNFIVKRTLEEIYDAEEYSRNCFKLEQTVIQLESNLEEQKKLNKKWMVLKDEADKIRAKELAEADKQAEAV